MNSMNVILNFLLLLLPLYLVNAAESETFCSTMNGESLRYTVRSRKNETSHRIVSVDLQKDSVRNKEKNATKGDVDVEVFHTYLQYSGKERIMLSTVVSTTELKSLVWTDDYELFPGLGFYKLHTNVENWETARSICVREGAHLIVINSDAEVEVVNTIFTRKPKFAGATYSHHVFVGVHDYLTEGQYMAVTGEPLDKTGYSSWAPGQPNGGSAANYLLADENGLLYDCLNTAKFGFICEKQL